MPKHIIINREGLPEGTDPPGFEESEDYVALGGEKQPPYPLQSWSLSRPTLLVKMAR